MQTKRGSEGNSPAGEGRRRDWSRHGTKVIQQGRLTGWSGRGQTLRPVGTCTEIELARRTHKLEMADVGTDQITDRQ